MTLEEKLALAEKLTARANAYREIQNTISGFTYYLRVQDQKGAMEQFWSQRDDIAFGAAKGRQNVVDFLITGTQKEKDHRQEIVNRVYGEQICPENDGIGDLESRAVTNPYIVIAEDMQTAQGLWFSPAVKAQVGEDGKLRARYLQEQIAVDLVFERGGWKIWHFFIVPELSASLASELFDDNYSGRTFDMDESPEGFSRGGPNHKGSGAENSAPHPDKEADDEHEEHKPGKPYGPTKVPEFMPPLPTPYEKWTPEETMPLNMG